MIQTLTKVLHLRFAFKNFISGHTRWPQTVCLAATGASKGSPQCVLGGTALVQAGWSEAHSSLGNRHCFLSTDSEDKVTYYRALFLHIKPRNSKNHVKKTIFTWRCQALMFYKDNHIHNSVQSPIIRRDFVWFYGAQRAVILYGSNEEILSLD